MCLGIWLSLRFKSIYCQHKNVRKPWRLHQLLILTMGFAQQLNFWERVERKAQQSREGKVLGREGSQEMPAQPWGGPTCKYALQSQGSKYRRLVSRPEEGPILGDAAFYIFSLSLAWYSSCRFYSKRARTQVMATNTATICTLNNEERAFCTIPVGHLSYQISTEVSASQLHRSQALCLNTATFPAVDNPPVPFPAHHHAPVTLGPIVPPWPATHEGFHATLYFGSLLSQWGKALGIGQE